MLLLSTGDELDDGLDFDDVGELGLHALTNIARTTAKAAIRLTINRV